MDIFKKFNLSYSAYDTYKRSPLQFYFQYISGIAQTDHVESANADAGTVVHEVLCKSIEGKTAAPIDDFHKAWADKGLITSRGIGGRVLDMKVYEKCLQAGLLVIHEAIYTGFKLYPEQRIEMQLHGIKVKGFIDVVAKTFDGKTMLIDWKTDSAFDESKHEGQRKFYSWIIWEQSGRTLIPGTSWHYLKHGKNVSQVFAEQELVDFEKEIRAFLLEVQQKGDNPANYDLGDFKSPFNAYKTACFDELNKRLSGPGTAKIILSIRGNFVFIEGDVDAKLLEGIDYATKFDLKQKYFMQKAAMSHGRGFQNIGDVGTVHLLNRQHKCFPVGLLPKVKDIINEYCDYYKRQVTIEIEDLRKFSPKIGIMPEKLASGVRLWQHQSDGIDAFMKSKNGIVNIATGGGKTVMAAEIIRRVDNMTLWIIDRIDLLIQTKKELEKHLGVDIGTIMQGEVNIKYVTIATVQTLSARLKELEDYLGKVNCVVVDEYHKSAAEGYQRLFAKIPNAEYRLGLTATVARDDGKEPMLLALLGSVVHKTTTQELIKLGVLVKPRIEFNEIGDGDDCRAFPDDYQTNIVESGERNQIICQQAISNKKTLIVTKLIEHGKALHSDIPGSRYIHGSVSMDDRKADMQWFKESSEGVLIMTLSIAAEGLDIPDLTCLINASGNGGDVKTIQVLGRLLRMITGKGDALYVDFIDYGKHTKRHSKARMKALREQGHEVSEI